MLHVAMRKPMTRLEFEQMSKLYDELWQKADAILRKFDPCGIRNGRCFRGSLCCNECEHLSKTGCTGKSLACKLWLCEKAAKAHRECAALLKKLKKEARSYPHIPLGYRSTKEDILARYKIVN